MNANLIRHSLSLVPLLFCVAVDFAYGQSNDAIVQARTQNDQPRAFYQDEYLLKNIDSSPSTSTEVRPLYDPIYIETYQHIQDSYRKNKEDRETNMKALGVANYMLKETLSGIKASANLGGGYGALAKIGVMLVEARLDNMYNTVDNRFKENIEYQLALDTQTFLDVAGGLSNYQELIANDDINGLVEALKRESFFIEEVEGEGFDDYQRVINDAKIKHLNRMFRQLGGDLAGTIGELNKRVNENHSGVLGNRTSIDSLSYQLRIESMEMNQFITALADTLISNYNELYDRQNELNIELLIMQKELALSTAITNENIKSLYQDNQQIKHYIYGQLSIGEKIDAIKVGFKTFASPEEKVKELRELERKKLKSDIINGGNYVIQEAEAALQILDHLSIEGEWVNTVRTSVNILSAGVNAFAHFSSGNYLSAAASISGLFGGGIDVATQRHEQLIGMLEDIYGGIEIIDEKVDTLLERQRIVIELQKETLESIYEIQGTLESNQITLLNALNNIHNDVLTNRAYSRSQLIASSYTQCDEIALKFSTGKVPIVSYNSNIIPDYNEIYTLHNSFGARVEACFAQLERILDNDTGPFNQMIFALEAYERHANEQGASLIDQFISGAYLPTLSLLSDNYFRGPCDGYAVIASLLNPVVTYHDLSAKLKYSICDLGSLPSDIESEVLRNPWRYLQTPLSSSAVINHNKLVLDLYKLPSYFHDNNPTKGPKSMIDIAQDNVQYNVRGLSWLKESLLLTDAAIAQQSLIHGDILLPLISRIFHLQRIFPPRDGSAHYGRPLYTCVHSFSGFISFSDLFVGLLESGDRCITDESPPFWTSKDYAPYILTSNTSDGEKDKIQLQYELLKNNVLSNNSVLATNFIKYELVRSNLIEYEFAKSIKGDSTLLQHITKLHFDFTWCEQDCRSSSTGITTNSVQNIDLSPNQGILIDYTRKPKGWSIRFGSRYYSLPTSEELSLAEFTYLPDFLTLISQRENLVNEIALYEVALEHSDAQVKLMTEIFRSTY